MKLPVVRFAAACTILLLMVSAAPLTGQRLDPSRVAASLDSLAAELRANDRPPGLTILVAEGPQVVFAKGYGHADLSHDVPATAQTVYNVGSVTKQFLAAAILRLAEEGKLRLDDDLRTYLPEFPTHGERVTLHHLLSSTSGIPRASNPPERSSERIDYSREETLATLISQYREKPFDFAPGEAWAYQNVNFLLLGFVVEKITGQSMWSYFREQFFAPLGMTATERCDPDMVMKHRAPGYVASERVPGGIALASFLSPTFLEGATGLCSSAPDLLRWQRGLVEHKVIGPESYARMTAPVALSNGHRSDYGYATVRWEIEGESVIFHTGGHRGYTAYLAYLPSRGVTVVILANWNTDIFSVGPSVIRSVLALPQPLDLPTSSTERASYIGIYESGPLRVEVQDREGVLTAAVSGSNSFRFLFPPRLLKQGQHTFALGWEPGSTLTFLPGEDRARGVVVRYGERTVHLTRKPGS